MFKKINSLLILISLIFINTTKAQESRNKKIQMGIVLGSSLNLSNSGTKLISIQNPGYDFTIGMNIIKSYNENIGFNTGFEFDFNTSRYNFENPIFYDYIDKEILCKNEKTNTLNYIKFELKERTEKPIFLSIPTMFAFKTDYFGDIKYFTKFGMRHSFILKETVDDKGISNTTNEKMNLKNNISIYSGSIGIAAGTEWNYYGNSSVLLELAYYYGISNMYRKDAYIGDIDKNKTLYTIENTNTPNYQTIKSTKNQIALKIAFLF